MEKFDQLIKIIERLTSPDGCPWDKVQTHQTIRANMIEEAYEAVDAIDSGDQNNMIEEFGDMLLQVVLHCDIAKRNGTFCLDDVIDRLNDKLISRHTHIFGDQKADNPTEAIGNWEAQKAKEKQYTSVKSQLKKLPAFPALLKAQKSIKKSGFKADAGQLKDLADNLSPTTAGEFLFVATALAHQVSADAEVALNEFSNDYINNLKD